MAFGTEGTGPRACVALFPLLEVGAGEVKIANERMNRYCGKIVSKQYKHFIFDLDGTLTRSRTVIAPEMASIISSLSQDVVIISGGAAEQIQKQVGNCPCIVMGQNGNHVIDHDGAELWKTTLTESQKREIRAHIQKTHDFLELRVRDEGDLVEDRGTQISYSLLGHHEDVGKKEQFDPDALKRRELLKRFPFESKTLEVKIGGTTCFDYFLKGRNKGHNIGRLIALKQWEKDDCLYFGDRLGPEGNDVSVIGVIDTQAVKDPFDTFSLLKRML